MAESEAIVVHEDALDAVCQVASRSIDQLIWQAPHGVAKAVTLLGAGVVVLPMLGRVSGIGARDSLQYSAHPQRALGGLMDRLDLELKFGALDPEKLIQELSIGRAALEKRLESLNDDDLREEVHALQDWREKAMGRLKTLEKRAAWAFLGVAGEGHVSQVEIKKAFKRRALELHPDKGGDAERFRLLQEMRDLLVEPKRHELEGGQEAKKEPAKKLEKGEEEAEDEEEDFSDDSWDADEEFRKMFPKRKKKQKRQEDAEPEVLKDQDFHRGRFEAARRKLQRQLRELWARAGRLAEEIDRSRCQPGAQEALRQLRRFVDRFEATEVKRLREDDPKKALRIFRRFLEQGSEVLCAAGALDPGATVSVVAMQVNCPLLQMACSEELQRRCAQLLEAIQELPEMGAVDLEDGLVYELLLPEEGEVPGTRLLQVQLPLEATLGDLRRAALRCGGFGGVVPRIFSGGRFVAGHDATPLTNLELATVLHCLPSNLVSRKAVEKQKRPSPKEVRQEVREEEVKEKPKDVEKSLEVKLLEEKSTQSSEKLQDVREENKENEDAWFDDFFAQGEKEKEEARRVQERGKNAMEARLKAQKQAQEAKKKLEERKLKAPSGKAAAFAAPASPEATAARLQTACTALVESKEEPSTELQKSRDTWDASWSHPCAGAKRSDGSAIFCGPCDSWVALGSRYDHRDFEIHCEKVGHFGWID